MATDEKQTLGQMIDSVKESIRLKWVEMHEHLASPEQRKALRAEIKDAVAGLGKTIRQFDPRRPKATKKAAPKKKASAKNKAAAKKKAPAKAKKKK